MARSSSVEPLEKFRFLVSFSNTSGSEATELDRAGFFEVQMPKRNTNKVQYREGNDPDIFMLSAGLSSMEDITLSRGQIASNAGTNMLYRWMSAVHKPNATITAAGAKGKDTTRTPDIAAYEYRKDVTISVLDRSGTVARKYVLLNAFPINFVPGSDLNAGEDGDKMIESITIAYEDFVEVAAATGNDVTTSASL